jgi:glycosyltransferase involved in cell wall biosynthesis
MPPVLDPLSTISPADGDRPSWLSVILPVYRGEEWLERTLASIAAEPDRGIEVVVIDSSPDTGSMAIIQSFADRLAFKVVDPEGLDGCSPKTNLGVRHASARHITWLCQDDLWLPGRAAAVRSWIAARPDAALHLAPTAIIDKDDKVRGIWRCPLPDGADPIDRTALLEKLLVQNFVAVPSPIIRRDAWLASGGLDLDLWYTGDWDMWIKLALQGDVLYHDIVTAAFRIHGASATSTGSRAKGDFEAQHRVVVERHIAAIPADRRAGVRRLADASIAVNTALAAAANGQPGSIGAALGSVLGLGPVGAGRYLHRSRIMDRVLPRLRAKFAGVL